MNTWSRCRRCGAINDHDAHLCYLCGASSLMKECPHCGAEFMNPMDRHCPSCKEPYQQTDPANPQDAGTWKQLPKPANKAVETR